MKNRWILKEYMATSREELIFRNLKQVHIWKELCDLGYGDPHDMEVFKKFATAFNSFRNDNGYDPELNDFIVMLNKAEVSLRENENKTVTAYKLFRVNKRYPSKIFPLFVDSNTPVPFGIWLEAKLIAPNEGGKIKSKLGDLAYRPGWHSGDIPVATHIGLKGSSTKPEFRNPDYVWAEVLVKNEVDWQSIANSRAKKNKQGEIIPVTAHITDQIPKNGFYRYKTNPNMKGTWLISGEIKVLRILSDEEVQQINSSYDSSDLPRKEPLDITEYGFTPEGKPNNEV